jgi:hypothetical protein
MAGKAGSQPQSVERRSQCMTSSSDHNRDAEGEEAGIPHIYLIIDIEHTLELDGALLVAHQSVGVC